MREFAELNAELIMSNVMQSIMEEAARDAENDRLYLLEKLARNRSLLNCFPVPPHIVSDVHETQIRFGDNREVMEAYNLLVLEDDQTAEYRREASERLLQRMAEATGTALLPELPTLRRTSPFDATEGTTLPHGIVSTANIMRDRGVAAHAQAESMSQRRRDIEIRIVSQPGIACLFDDAFWRVVIGNRSAGSRKSTYVQAIRFPRVIDVVPVRQVLETAHQACAQCPGSAWSHASPAERGPTHEPVAGPALRRALPRCASTPRLEVHLPLLEHPQAAADPVVPTVGRGRQPDARRPVAVRVTSDRPNAS